MLLVGAGQRVQNNFLPVLRVLGAHFSVLGVHARTAANLQPVADLWGVPAIASLAGPEVKNADVIAISVPTGANEAVLQALRPYAARLTIVIDTPIVSGRRELAAAGPLLAQFKRVVVTEDYMNFPAFALVRQAVAQGLIGEPRALTLNGIGFAYHGLALIRSFAGFEPAARTGRRKIGASATITFYKFKRGYSACVIGPYRRGTLGGLTLEGSQGVISQFADDLSRATESRPVYLLAPCFSEGYLSGYRIEAGEKSLEICPPELAAMRALPFADKSEHNLQRGCGLAAVFRSLLGDDDDPATRLNLAYGAENAFYDVFVSGLADRGFLPFDPLTWIGRDVMTAIRAISRLHRSKLDLQRP